MDVCSDEINENEEGREQAKTNTKLVIVYCIVSLKLFKNISLSVFLCLVKSNKFLKSIFHLEKEILIQKSILTVGNNYVSKQSKVIT